MNRVLIYGGLGNQMFQYALANSLNKKGIKSKILISNYLFNSYNNGLDLTRAFALDLPFPLNFINYLIQKGEFIYKNKFVFYFLKRIIPFIQNKKYTSYFETAEFIFDKNVFSQKNKLLIGTWQDENYFRCNRENLIETFKFNIPADKLNRELINKIKHCNAISIHIRRGDYLSSKWINSHNVLTGNQYYISAIKHLDKLITNPHYFIFSDDLNWAQMNFPFPNCTFVDHNRGKKSYIDMYLMSICKHNIIANSTFSWWAAWLNIHKNKIVIMPDKWLLKTEAIGVFPPEWIKMKF